MLCNAMSSAKDTNRPGFSNHETSVAPLHYKSNALCFPHWLLYEASPLLSSAQCTRRLGPGVLPTVCDLPAVECQGPLTKLCITHAVIFSGKSGFVILSQSSPVNIL